MNFIISFRNELDKDSRSDVCASHAKFENRENYCCGSFPKSLFRLRSDCIIKLPSSSR